MAVGVVILLVIVGILYRRSDYVQKTTIYKCSLPEIKTALSSQALLIAPISGGYPVLVPRYKPAGDTSNWTFNAEYYAPIWGANGWGIVDVHLADDSSGNNSVSARLYQDGRWRPVLPAGQIQCRL